MNIEEIASKMAEAGTVREGCAGFEKVTMKDLDDLSEIDKIADVVKKALMVNSGCECDLYVHQYEALYALARGCDVMLITPCGSGKTRVLQNAAVVVKFGIQLRSGKELDKNPLAIVCCPLSSIMEDKIDTQENSGMLSMYGSCKSGPMDGNKVKLSRGESDFLTDDLSLIFGHAESFTTEIGKKVLEANEDRIFLFAADEVGFNVWGPNFRPLMSSVPGSIRVFSTENAPMLCMSATVGKSDQAKVLEDMGMTNRKHLIIDKNPVMPHVFVSKLRRPSNQKGFDEAGGLKDILCSLYLEEFLRDPLECRKAVIFCKNEEDLISVYEFIEDAVGDKFKNLKTRPWIQYHGSLGKNTLKWIHHRIQTTDKTLEIKLYISTYKIIMGVDVKDIDLAIFVRYSNFENINQYYMNFCSADLQTLFPV